MNRMLKLAAGALALLEPAMSARAFMPPEPGYHDWTVAVGHYPFGILLNSQGTYIFLGPLQPYVPVRGPILLAGVVALGLALAFFCWRPYERSKNGR
jgi:hypothetical protein